MSVRLQNESGYNAEEKKTILQRITEWLSDIIEAIKEIMNDDELNGAGKLFAKQQCDELAKIRKMFLEALDGAGVNYREGGAVEGDVRNSIKVTQHVEYAEQIDKLFNKTLSRSDSIYIGVPSSKLQQVVFSANPFAMNQADLRKSNKKTAKNKKYSRHGVPRKFFKLLPEYINEAVIFIENENGITIVTEYPMLDTKEKLSYVVAGVKLDTAMEDDVVNLIKSVYPLGDFKTLIMRIAENGKLIITDKEKAQTILATVGVQPSEVSRLFELSRDNLSQKGINVKKNSIETDSKGRKLTREQSEFFKDSKAIDEKGDLKVVYHGTRIADFTVFKRNARYFTDNKEMADSYSPNGDIFEGYVNITKPYEIDAAGEIEARDATARLSLTAEERKNTRPDIDRKDVVFAEGGVSYSQEYESAKVNVDIISLIEKVKTNDYKDNEKVELGIVSEKTAEEIKKLFGVDVSGYKMVIESRQVLHIMKDYGIYSKSDRSMSNDADITKMEYGYNRTAPTILYEKYIGDRSYYVVYAVPESKKEHCILYQCSSVKKDIKKKPHSSSMQKTLMQRLKPVLW